MFLQFIKWYEKKLSFERKLLDKEYINAMAYLGQLYGINK